MLGAVAAFAMLWSAAFPSGEPIAYEAAVAADFGGVETPDTADSSRDTDALGAEQAELMANPLMNGDPDWRVSWTMYHAGGGGATGNDSLGCRPIAMRTVAVDPRVIPRRTRLFIRESVGMRLPDGTVHDGYWYATDTGGAIKGRKIDLYTGHGRASMQAARVLNPRQLTVLNAGRFDGCPPAWRTASN